MGVGDKREPPAAKRRKKGVAHALRSGWAALAYDKPQDPDKGIFERPTPPLSTRKASCELLSKKGFFSFVKNKLLIIFYCDL